MFFLCFLSVLTESGQISETKKLVNQLWKDLNNLAIARSQALAGAKELHVFARDAADARQRVQVPLWSCV